MPLEEKIATLPVLPGVYLFRDAAGQVLYVGKAQSLRSRVKSYFLAAARADAKTGSLVREIAELETIVVDNEKEALALENSLIKRHRPRFNVLLRDDKTYPYIRFTAFEQFPRVYVTRRLKKDGSMYFGPYFPHSLAHRIVHFIHKRFLIPSCTVDLTRAHPRPCLQYYIKRCHGPCVPGLVSDDRYAEAARDVRLFLEGRRGDLLASLETRMQRASDEERFEEAAGYRDLLRTVHDLEEKQKIAAARGDDIDVVAWYAEPPLVAANVFHLRAGRVVDRRDFYWEDLEEFRADEFLPALLKQLYLDAAYVPRFVHVPAEFDDRVLLEELLSEHSGHRVEIVVPQRGSKRALVELVDKNARHSFEQRFRVSKPSPRVIADALQGTLNLPEPPRRIESFDISHLQGADTVASMVVWEDGRMKKSDYRRFIIHGEAGNDDFASLREAVERRYLRLLDERQPLPSLILIDGGLGQLHAAAQALEKLEIINQPIAAIAKPPAPRLVRLASGPKERPFSATRRTRKSSLHSRIPTADSRPADSIFVLGQEDDPIRLDRHSPILHLVQQIRDETHRFAVTFHRQRRARRQLASELTSIPGIGEATARKLLRKFGSMARVRQATFDELSAVVTARQARALLDSL